jgi:tetratricopeptide (TPR) repeat protein
MAKRKKKVNRRVLLLLIVMGVLVLGAGAALYVRNLPKNPQVYIAAAEAALAETPVNYEAAVRGFLLASSVVSKDQQSEYSYKAATTLLDWVSNDQKLTMASKRKHYGDARGLLQKIIVSDQTYLPARRLMAEQVFAQAVQFNSWSAQKEYADHADVILAADPTDHQTYFRRGVVNERRGQRDPSYIRLVEADLRKAIELDPSNLGYWSNLCRFMIQQSTTEQDYAQVEATYRQAIEANPKKSLIYLQYMGFLKLRGRDADAIEALNVAVTVEPDSALAPVQLAQHHLQRREMKAASEALDEAEKRDPTYARIYESRARIARMSLDLDKATAELRKGISVLNEARKEGVKSERVLNADIARANYWLAELLLDVYNTERNKDKTKAQTALTDAKSCHAILWQLSPEEYNQYKIAGQIALAEGRYEQALRDLEEAKKRLSAPGLPRFDHGISRSLMRTYDALNMPSNAEKTCSQILAQFPSSVAYLKKMALYRLQSQDFGMALAYVRRALKYAPDDKDAMGLVDAIQFAQGKGTKIPAEGRNRVIALSLLEQHATNLLASHQVDQATEALNRVVKTEPLRTQAWARLLTLLLRQNRQVEAVQRLDAMVKAYPKEKQFAQWKKLVEETDPAKKYEIEQQFTDTIEDPKARLLTKYQIAKRYPDHAAEASGYLKELTEAFGEDATILKLRLSLAMKDSDWDQAEEIVKVMETQELPRVAHYRGMIKRGKGETKEAIVELEAMVASKPHLRDPRLLLAACYVEDEQYDLAKKQYQEVLSIDARSVPALLGLAKLAARQQDFQLHDQMIQRAWRLPSGKRNPEVRERYLRIQVVSDKVKEVIAEREALLRTNPKNADNVYRLARLYDRTGQVNKAKSLYEQLYAAVSQKVVLAPVVMDFYRRAGLSTQADKLYSELYKEAKTNEERATIQVMYGQFLANSGDRDAGIGLIRKALDLDRTQANAYRVLASQLMISGNARRKSGDREGSIEAYREAIDSMSKVVQLEEKDALAKLRLYGMCAEAGFYDRALTGYKSMLSDSQENADVLLGLAQTYLLSGNTDEAKRALDKAFLVAPNEPLVHQYLADVAKSQRRLTDARDHLARAVTLSRDPRYRMALAKVRQGMGDLPGAAREYERLISATPGYLPVYLGMIDLMQMQRKFTVAEKWAKQGMKRFPTAIAFPMRLAKGYQAEKKLQQQANILKQVLDTYPNGQQFVHQYVFALVDLKQYTQATEAVKKYCAGEARRPYAQLFNALIAAKKNPEATQPIETILSVLRSHPAGEYVHPATAVIVRAYGNERLLSLSKQLIDACPKSWQLYNLLGSVCLSIEPPRYEEALRMFQNALQHSTHSPSRVQVLHGLARVYDRLGQTKRLLGVYETLLKADPDNVLGLNNLAYHYVETLQKPEKAKPLIERALRLNPSDPFLADTYAWVLAKMGQYDKAASILRDVVSVPNIGPDVLYHMGYVLEKKGSLREAEEYYQRALSKVESKPSDPLNQVLKAALARIAK